MISFCFFIYFSFIFTLFSFSKFLNFKFAYFTCIKLNFIYFFYIFQQILCKSNLFKSETVVNREKHVKCCKNYEINVIHVIIICYLYNFKFKINIIL